MAKGWESEFPNLEDWQESSPITRTYNCFAWAAEDSSRRWEPDQQNINYWPDGVPRRLSLTSVVKAYQSIGYEHSTHGSPEVSFQKIVIYVDDLGVPRHVARQLPDGQWTSKLGDFEDITHKTPECLSGDKYGKPKRFLKKLLPKVS